MKGYRIIALTNRAEEHLLKINADKKSKMATIEIVCDKPLTISVLFNKRYKIVNFIKEDIIHLWVQRDMPFCKKGTDYNVEVLQ